MADTPERADALHEDLRTLGGAGVRCYPQRETLPYEDADPHVEIAAQRVDAMSTLLAGRCRILVTTARALAERDPIPLGAGPTLALPVAIGDTHALSALAERLEGMGFSRTHTVSEVGDYAVRGGIVDLFPFGHPAPLRIELWGDEVASLRRFDALTQRSTETLERTEVLPIALRAPETGAADAVERRALVETLPPTTLALVLDPEAGVRARARLWSEVREARRRVGTRVDPAEWFVVPAAEAESRLASLRRLEFQRESTDAAAADAANAADTAGTAEPTDAAPGDAADRRIDLPLAPPPRIDRDMKRLLAEVGTSRARGERILVLCDNDGQVERLEEILEARGGAALLRDVTLAVGSLSGGFRVGIPGTLLVLTDHEVFRRRYRRHRVRMRGAATIESIASIGPGDYVVHMDHGIGRYVGLERVEVQGETMETLEIRYADGEILRLPHYRLDLLERWSATGSDARPPAVHKLGRRKWKQLKRRTVAAIETTAVELLQLYARRQMTPGRAFPPETSWQREMESAFLYEETPDQLSAWEAVRADLEAPVPMDRLVCGDVGFGKTEVAIRAAFKAAQDGTQVAVLAPTTILADQHLGTFRERLAGFPVRIEALSRFRTPREQREVIAGLADGMIDIVIGTHRLLSRDVRFRELGLLIVDEEQRFGVRQKERLKEVRETVDVLTLTATPIPRTLHLALGGLRDLSTIRTPPRNRMPIITHVLPWHDVILEEALRRELDRGGQVFFVHDRVETIGALAQRVRRLMPEARAEVAHGQMPERNLEEVMHRFVRAEIDILICTSIIENGLDVASANTMVVHGAHNFGLAQLYQLRGRVGRSHRRAYCYLVVPENVAPEAAQRLRVLEHHTELGSGYQVALRDLELRGAGNLLGGEQSGFATAVGIDTYQRLVESTLRRLKGESSEAGPSVRVSIDGESLLPDDYVSGSRLKMHLYRRLARLSTWDEVRDFRAELEDRFGPLPGPARRLLGATELRILGAAVEADWIRVSEEDARISFEASAAPRLGLLTHALADRQLDVEVRRLEPLSLVLRRAGAEPLLPTLVDALGILATPGRAEAEGERAPVTAGGAFR